MDTPLAWLSDQQLIALARKAGLCFPDCWHLDEIATAGGLADDAAWIEGAPDDDERSRRSDIVEASGQSARQKLTQLRAFAALISAESAHQ